jgi:NAD(P)-dependent dehydrogenase (short-subunit alcohol dehydrogenase family)
MSKNKIALVTGWSRWLWKNMALRVAEKWLNVIITYKNNQNEAKLVSEEIIKMWQKSYFLQLDSWNMESINKFSQELGSLLKNEFSSNKLDYLVNNAWIGIHKNFIETTEEDFDSLFNIHLKWTFFITQKLLPILNDWSWIINVSSWLTRFSFPWYSAYASMKWAIEVLTRYLAKELWDRKVRVNVIAPWAIETDFWGWAIRDVKELNNFVSWVTALGRAWLPNDIWWVVAFLCSDDSKWINWQRIEISWWMML